MSFETFSATRNDVVHIPPPRSLPVLPSSPRVVCEILQWGSLETSARLLFEQVSTEEVSTGIGWKTARIQLLTKQFKRWAGIVVVQKHLSSSTFLFEPPPVQPLSDWIYSEQNSNIALVFFVLPMLIRERKTGLVLAAFLATLDRTETQ